MCYWGLLTEKKLPFGTVVKNQGAALPTFVKMFIENENEGQKKVFEIRRASSERRHGVWV